MQLMHWELGLLDLLLAPAEGVSPYGGASYEAYAAHFQFTPETAAYARERLAETRDVVLALHYAEFALLRAEPRGRAWIELQRRLLTDYRAYIEGCRAGAGGPNDRHHHADVYIDRALTRVAQLVARPGVLRGAEASEWAGWLVALAESSRTFPVQDDGNREQQRHRWLADYLAPLGALPPNAADEGVRARTLAVLDQAAAYYRAAPLNDHFEHHVAHVEATLRKHWGEAGTHERMIRRQFDATVRRAELHEATGHGLSTAHFYREARRLVERERQYFGPEDVARLERAEQAAHERGVAAGELVRMRVPLELPEGALDLTRETTDDTTLALVAHAVTSVPSRDVLERSAQDGAEDAPLLAMIPRVVLGAGKVVGESATPDKNLALDAERHAMLRAHLAGAAVSTTVAKAAVAVGLTADHLVAPLAALGLDAGTTALVRYACERMIAGDFVAATHVLVLRVEDVLRQHLKRSGVDTTMFRPDVGDGTSRTDDAPLGALLRKTLPDGRAVEQYLGPDLWWYLNAVLNSQTGLNLRNEFAHGLARPGHCTPENAGLALALLYALASVAGTDAVRYP